MRCAPICESYNLIGQWSKVFVVRTAREGRKRQRDEDGAEREPGEGRVVGGSQAMGQGVPSLESEGLQAGPLRALYRAGGRRRGSGLAGVEAAQTESPNPGCP